MEVVDYGIILPQIDPATAIKEIGDGVVKIVTEKRSTGCVIGMSGGADSTLSAAVIKDGFDRYNTQISDTDKHLELIGYMLPTKINNPSDTEDGINVAERLGIRHYVKSIEELVEAKRNNHPKFFEDNDVARVNKGNLISRLRATELSDYAAEERKCIAGTGNKDEDYGVGYFTMFGDGAVHFNTLGNLSKRLVFQILEHMGFHDIAAKDPAAGLEEGQTDFKDLGYHYDVVEMVIEGKFQGYSREELIDDLDLIGLAVRDVQMYADKFGKPKYTSTKEIVDDIIHRHQKANDKAEIIHPPAIPVTLSSKMGELK